MQVGNRIIADQDGDIIYQTGEMQGDVIPRKEITALHHIDLEYGEIDLTTHRIIGIDIETKKPILEEVKREKTAEEKVEELENQLMLAEEEKTGGIL